VLAEGNEVSSVINANKSSVSVFSVSRWSAGWIAAAAGSGSTDRFSLSSAQTACVRTSFLTCLSYSGSYRNLNLGISMVAIS